jgi:hypothetical protein
MWTGRVGGLWLTSYYLLDNNVGGGAARALHRSQLRVWARMQDAWRWTRL